MQCNLISYSEILIPLPPRKDCYVIGIAENARGERLLVRIAPQDVKNLALGGSGTVTREEFADGWLNVFKPRS